MSIASEITRLQGVKSDILQAIADKGVTIPTGSALADCPALIADIPSGSDIPPEIEIYERCTTDGYNRGELSDATAFPITAQNRIIYYGYCVTSAQGSSSTGISGANISVPGWTYGLNFGINRDTSGIRFGVQLFGDTNIGGFYSLGYHPATDYPQKVKVEYALSNGVQYASINNTFSYSKNDPVTDKTAYLTTVAGYDKTYDCMSRIIIFDENDTRKIKNDIRLAKNTDTNKIGVFDLVSGVFVPLKDYAQSLTYVGKIL